MSNLAEELLEILGEADFIRMAEHFAGCRVYVPERGNKNNASGYRKRPSAWESKLDGAVGEDAARKLTERFGGDYIRMPMAREVRAVHYRKQGLSNGKIALKLGMTETGVNWLFRKLREQRAGRPANSNPRKDSLAPSSSHKGKQS